MGHMWWDATFGLNSVTPKLVSQCFPNFNKSQARAPPCFAPTQPRCHTNPAASPEHVLSTEASVSYPSGHLGSLESHKKLKKHNNKKTKMKSKSASYFLLKHQGPCSLGFPFHSQLSLGAFHLSDHRRHVSITHCQGGKDEEAQPGGFSPLFRGIIPFLGIEMR